MNPDNPINQPVAIIQDPVSDVVDHIEDRPHSPEEEIAHARQHAWENMYFFAGFFTLILFAVAYYEFCGSKNLWVVLALAAARAVVIAGFFVWLIGHFSFVVRTLVFTVVFFIGMVFLSLWDSEVPIFGNPIKLPEPKVSAHPHP